MQGGDYMNMIRPVSDLRNCFADISKTVHETAQPVFLTKNGYGDMVVLSMEAFERLQFESEVYFKLQEAEREAEITNKRFSSKEVLKAMKEAIGGEPVSYTHLEFHTVDRTFTHKDWKSFSFREADKKFTSESD